MVQWRSTPAFSDDTQTYNTFEAGILRMYPGASNDCTYTNQDLEALIGEHVRIGR